MTSSGLLATGLIDPQGIIQAAGPWALLGVCAIVFVETGLLVGFFLPATRSSSSPGCSFSRATSPSRCG